MVGNVLAPVCSENTQGEKEHPCPTWTKNMPSFEMTWATTVCILWNTNLGDLVDHDLNAQVIFVYSLVSYGCRSAVRNLMT
jgi:hypothetical protein